MKTYQKLFLACLSSTVAMSANAGGAIVAAKNSPIPAFDAEQAKKVFLGREAQLSGLPVTVVMQKEGPTRSAFESTVLGKSGPEVSAYWAKLIFTGKANAPVEASNDGEVKSKVDGTPGAVGYISDGAVDGSIKVLLKY